MVLQTPVLHLRCHIALIDNALIDKALCWSCFGPVLDGTCKRGQITLQVNTALQGKQQFCKPFEIRLAGVPAP
jgi:hypothetical protein